MHGAFKDLVIVLQAAFSVQTHSASRPLPPQALALVSVQRAAHRQVCLATQELVPLADSSHSQTVLSVPANPRLLEVRIHSVSIVQMTCSVSGDIKKLLKEVSGEYCKQPATLFQSSCLNCLFAWCP